MRVSVVVTELATAPGRPVASPGTFICIIKACPTRTVGHGWGKADPYTTHVWHLYRPHTVTGLGALAQNGAFMSATLQGK